MSVQSSPIACCGFSCRIRTFFLCTASTGFVKVTFFLSLSLFIFIYMFFFLLCRLLHNDQNNSGFRQIGRIGNIIGFILALRRPFAE